jgi:hypothetical protein
MILYRLRKIGSMLYYNGSCYGRVKTSTRGRWYKRKCDLTNSVRLVKDFQKHEWELQHLRVKVGWTENYGTGSAP